MYVFDGDYVLDSQRYEPRRATGMVNMEPQVLYV
jgi:hypothetical protein